MESHQILIQISLYVFCFAIGALVEHFNLKYDQIIYRTYEKLVITMKKIDSKLSFFTKLAILIIILVILGNYISVNYALVTVALTGFLLMATYQYALLTQDLVYATTKNTQLSGELVSETNKMRKAQTQPNVFISIKPVDELNYIFEFFIQNIGLGPAYNLKFIDPPIFQYAKDKFLSEIHLIKNEIEFLAPNQKMQIFMMQSFEVFELNSKDPITIKIKYADSRHEEFEREEFERDYKIDFSIVKDVQRLKYRYTDFEHSMVTNAEAMSKSLSNISFKVEKSSDNLMLNTGLIQSDSSELLAATENYDLQVKITKIIIKKVLLGFCTDWKTYSNNQPDNPLDIRRYVKFIHDNKRLMHHLEQFSFVSIEVRAVGILPETVPDKLDEFATRMRVITGIGVFNENMGTIVKEFDELLADIKEMDKNVDKICSAA